MIFVLTGNGKGKTTSAIGMGIRAVGAGRRVLMVQFLKVPTSEVNVLNKIENFVVRTFGERGFPVPHNVIEENPNLVNKGVREISNKDKEIIMEGWKFLQQWVEEKKCDFLILDELTHVVNYGLLDKEEVLTFLKKHREKLDIVITGRYCPQEFLVIADLITEMLSLRHPYERGEPPRKGIEY